MAKTFSIPPSPSVSIEQGSGRSVSPSWYQFFINILNQVGGGTAPLTLSELITSYIAQRLHLTVPAWLTVSGSPVGGATGINGTLAITSASEPQNLFLASPNGAAGALSPRAIVAADIGTIAVGGDLSGSIANATVAKINGTTLGTTTATSGNVLIGSGAAWVTHAISGDATLSSTGGVVVTAINGATLGTTTATAGNLLIGSGAAWVTHAMSTDATLSSTGALTIANNAITTAKINNSAVTYAKIQNETASTLLGNPTGGAAAPAEITLGATLTFSGAAMQTIAISGDATSSANSFATTVGAISGHTVSPTSWTPADSSGATLVFTAVSANYTRLGNMVFAYGALTYPATVSGANAQISGLPFTVANAAYANVPFSIRNTSASFGTIGIIQPNTIVFNIINDVTGAAITNAQLSTVVLRFMAIYPVA